MTKTRPLDTRTKLLFSLGDLSISIPLVIVSFYQLNFLTDIARLSPALAATAILAGKLWDAVNDPLIGLWADRIQSPFGRRRILLAAGAFPLGLSFMLLWLTPDLGEVGKVLYYSFAIILFDTAFTVVHIAFNSLTPRLTGNFDEQSGLHGYRMFFQLLGNLGAVILITVLGWYAVDRALLFRSAGVVLGLAAALPPLIVISVTGAYRDVSPGRKFRLGSLESVFRSRPFLLMVGFYLMSWTASSILASMLIYFVRYNMNMPAMSDYVILTTQVAAMACIPLVVMISKKQDKKTSFILGSTAMILTLMGISFLQAGQTILIFALAVASGWGIATSYVVPWSMIPDLLDYEERRSGRRMEGAYYAFASFFQKTGTGIAMWIIGQMLDLRGYVTPAAGEIPVQPESALRAIQFVMGPFPALLLLMGIILAMGYPITRSSHAETLRELGRGDEPLLAED
jgi:GPH family glycoside/pentoside/hexuronide:cation symporter